MGADEKLKNFLENASSVMQPGQKVKVAAECGIASQRLSEILLGRRKNGCFFITAIKIADSIGYSMDELMSDPAVFLLRIKKREKFTVR